MTEAGRPDPSRPAGPPGPGAGAEPSPDDEAVLRALRDALAAADPLPDAWRRDAVAAFDWLAQDAEQAEVAYDSIEDVHRPLGGLAAGDGTERRRVRFEARDVAVEVEVQVTADALRLLGRVTPYGATRVRALTPAGEQVAAAGERGTFRFDDLSREPVSLLVEGQRRVKTGWIVP